MRAVGELKEDEIGGEELLGLIKSPSVAHGLLRK
jgi:hypothetical protein